MSHDPAKLFEDVLRAIEEIEAFCQGKSFSDFQKDRGLQVNTSGRAGGLKREPLKADCLGAARGGGQSNIFI